MFLIWEAMVLAQAFYFLLDLQILTDLQDFFHFLENPFTISNLTCLKLLVYDFPSALETVMVLAFCLSVTMKRSVRFKDEKIGYFLQGRRYFQYELSISLYLC